jgi:hypothetical protein
MNEIENITSKLWNQVHYQVSFKVFDQVKCLNEIEDNNIQICHQVFDQVWGEVHNKVMVRIGGQIVIQVNVKVWDQIEDKVGDQVINSMERNFKEYK